MSIRWLFLAGTLLLLSFAPREAEVIRQITRPGNANAYLVFDPVSKEAALIDPGGPVDSLTAIIDSRGLTLKFIFLTHAHADHTMGVMAVRSKYPDAQVGITRIELEEASGYAGTWEQVYAPAEVARIKSRPDLLKLVTYDLGSECKPDLLLEDGQVYRLGALEMKAILTPGHSKGNISLQIGKSLFTGDVLMKGTTGRTDLPTSSAELMKTSVLRLYKEVPGGVHVYPGHGDPTTINREKRQNRNVRID